MTQQNDKAVLETVLAALQPDGIARFDAGRYSRRTNSAPSRTVLKRLAEEGYVEVESHSVSVWTYGAGFLSYTIQNAQARKVPLTPQQQAEYDRWKRLRREVGDGEWKDRTEVWVRITRRGREYLEMLRALS